MSRGDHAVERAAARLEMTAQRFAAEGGTKAKLAEMLADDAAFVRQMKPSLIRARMKGEARTDGGPAQRAPLAPGVAQLGERSKPKGAPGDGPNPFVVVAAAFAVGIVLAKLIDWRGHAHPRV
jgi:hypothetical protein